MSGTSIDYVPRLHAFVLGELDGRFAALVGSPSGHEMSSYPYASRERFPDDADSLAYRLDWNDRTETGERTQRFQFDYKHTLSAPMLQLP